MTTPTEPGDPQGEYPTEAFSRPTEAFTAPATPPPTRGRFFRRPAKKPLVVGGVAAAVVVVGAVGFGIWATSGSSQPVATAAASTTSTSDAPAAGSAGDPKPAHKARGVVGTITAESGNSWTVQAKSGKTVTVTVGPSTQFGTKKLAQQQSQFAVGDTIAVQGPVTDGTVTAVRIAERPTTATTDTTGAAPATAGTPA